MTSQAGPSGTQRPVIAVVGTTGVGKSNLAVSLCHGLANNPSNLPRRGKVLSADSMQLYKGLDVITNKVTVEEQGGVEHWGLDVVQPGQRGSWEVGKWCNEADREVRFFKAGLTEAGTDAGVDAARHLRGHALLHPALSLPARRAELRSRPRPREQARERRARDPVGAAGFDAPNPRRHGPASSPSA